MEKIKKCDVCGNEIKVDNWGNGHCHKCGWSNDENALSYPNSINPPNFVSLNETKFNYQNKIIYKPTFDRVIELVDRGLDIVIKYKKCSYQLSKHEDYTLWEIDTKNYQSYNSIKELKDNAKINNILLKDLWKDIKYIKYDC